MPNIRTASTDITISCDYHNMIINFRALMVKQAPWINAHSRTSAKKYGSSLAGETSMDRSTIATRPRLAWRRRPARE